MNKINVIGLGPGNIESLTIGALNRIKDGNRNYLRTKFHPTVSYLDDNNIEYIAYDDAYEKFDDFEDVYGYIVGELLKEAEEYGEINYFIPGNPMIAEKTVEILLTKKDIIDVQIISGMSFIEPMLELLGKDPIDGLKIIDGAAFRPTLLDINSDLIITQTYNRRILIDLKLFISDVYGDEYTVYVVHGAGIPGEEKLEEVPVYQMDQIEDIGYLTSVYIPKVDKGRDKIFDFNDLVDIMNILRGEDGCPWDIKQTHESLKGCIVEEAYELVNAIENDDIDNMIEEVGDILLLVLFHSSIGYDNGEFSLSEITSNLANKLIFRHPHIFSENKVVNEEEVLYNWNRLKQSQRNLVTASDKMKDITPNLPLLIKSTKTQEVAASIGFDWEDVNGPLEKLIEEYNEVIEAMETAKSNPDHIEEELGDVLFSVVNLARFLDINPEIALNRANNKFINRFIGMEEIANEEGIKLDNLSVEEWDRLWNLAKNNH